MIFLNFKISGKRLETVGKAAKILTASNNTRMYEKFLLLYRVADAYQKDRRDNKCDTQNKGIKRFFRDAFPLIEG